MGRPEASVIDWISVGLRSKLMTGSPSRLSGPDRDCGGGGSRLAATRLRCHPKTSLKKRSAEAPTVNAAAALTAMIAVLARPPRVPSSDIMTSCWLAAKKAETAPAHAASTYMLPTIVRQTLL